jgi:hypothetical protein
MQETVDKEQEQHDSEEFGLIQIFVLKKQNLMYCLAENLKQLSTL